MPLEKINEDPKDVTHFYATIIDKRLKSMKSFKYSPDTTMTTNERKVFCADAIQWLKDNTITEGSLVASLPDISEFQQSSLVQWKQWFTDTARLVLSSTPSNGLTFFYQTDIKWEGTWVDKGYLCQKAAEEVGHQLLWHKVICRAPAGTITFGRPAYSHILCFSKDLRVDPAKSTADVIPGMGEKTWERGMGYEACQMIARFIKSQATAPILIHPFCGEGGMLAVANQEGLSAIGIERSPKRAERAQAMKVSQDGKFWV